MNILDRALELVKLDQAMSEMDIAEIINRDVNDRFDGETFAQLLAATITGFNFNNSNVTRHVEGDKGARVHTLTLNESMEVANPS